MAVEEGRVTFGFVFRPKTLKPVPKPLVIHPCSVISQIRSQWEKCWSSWSRFRARRTVIMNLVHIRCDDHDSQPFIKSFPHPYVGMLQQCTPSPISLNRPLRSKMVSRK